MSRLEKLIQELCPNGVEYKKIKELAEVGTGSSNGNESVEGGKYPFFVRSQTIKSKDDYEYDEEAIIIPGEGGIGEIFHYINGPYALHQRVYRIHFLTKNINVKFVYYYMNFAFKDFILKKAVSSTVTSIRKPMIEDFKIPVPPMEVQCEIVHILDQFTLLTAEFTAEVRAELTARRKQYEYYRDLLFSDIDEKYSKKLGEISSIIRGGNFQKSDFVEDEKPCIHYGQIYTYFGVHTNSVLKYLPENIYGSSKKASYSDIVMAVTSENLDDVCKSVAWLGNEDIAISGHTAIIKHNQNPKFLSYFFSSSTFSKQKIKYAHGTKVIEVTPKSLVGIDIPIPPLEEQQRIVDILDKFDTYCNDLTQGLPAEIELRKQQYEYYRDKLLSFKELK